MRDVVAESTKAPQLSNDPSVCTTATEVEQLHDAAQRTAMSISQVNIMLHQNVTPPSSFINQPLTPPLTDKRPFAGALRVISLFRKIQAGRDTKQGPWIEFQFAQGEYDELESTLQQDDVLWGFVKDMIR